MSGPIFTIINPDLWLKTAAPQNSRGPTMPLLADPIPNAVLGKWSGIMQYIELSPVAAFLLCVNIIIPDPFPSTAFGKGLAMPD